jgi:hypothetical protein
MTENVQGMIEAIPVAHSAKAARAPRLTGTQDAAPRTLTLGAE